MVASGEADPAAQPHGTMSRAQTALRRNNMKNWTQPTGRGLALTAAVTFVALTAWAGPAVPQQNLVGGFAIGCQAYTFNRFTAFEAIEKTAAAGGRVIEFYPGQVLSKEDPGVRVDHNASDEVINKLQAKLKQHGVLAVNYGVVGLPNREEECRKVFAFAKKMGLLAVTSEPSMEAMDLLEKLAKEYDVKVAIHNHPRRANDPNYKVWDPNYVLSMVKGRDARLGACADTGHWVRSDLKPIEALRILQGRIVSCHLKDLHQFGGSAHDVPFGTGVSEVKAVLDELRRQKFDGNISIEYEFNWDNSVPDVAQCIGFVRGYGAASK
jgi:sugar phosphate isomerase/epimerase